jgi:predicted ester cyclase
MSASIPSNTPQPEEEEEIIDLEKELTISFTEGFYMHTPSGEIRRATVEGARVIWFEATFDTFIGVEIRSSASQRRILGDLRFLPNFLHR